MNPIKIVLADDHRIFLEGLYLLLENVEDIKIVGDAENGEVLLELVEKHKPDLVITDIKMPIKCGIEATKEIKKLYPGIKVIALTMFNDDFLIIDMLEAGAGGYLIKNTTKVELVTAIKAVHAGGNYYCNTTSEKLLKMLIDSRLPLVSEADVAEFTDRELEIMQLICQEYSSKQIAPMLNLSAKTVENYRNKILEKTGAKNVVGIVIYAIRNRLFKL